MLRSPILSTIIREWSSKQQTTDSIALTQSHDHHIEAKYTLNDVNVGIAIITQPIKLRKLSVGND